MDIKLLLLVISFVISAYICRGMFLSTYRGIKDARDDFDKSADYTWYAKLMGSTKEGVKAEKVGEFYRPFLLFTLFVPAIPASLPVTRDLSLISAICVTSPSTWKGD